MKKLAYLCVVVALAASVRADVPFIARESVTLLQSAKSAKSLAIIRYRLTGGPAIVTVDIQTNVNRSASGPDSDWISIGEVNFRNVAGDVNKLARLS